MLKKSLSGSLRDKASYFLHRTKRRNYYKTIFFAFMLLLIIVYNIIFSPAVFQKIVKSQFEKYTNGIINLTVLKSSLLRGFSIENIEVLSGEDFDRLPIIKIDKFNLLYSIYGFFAGDAGIHELGIYNPRISLYHKGSLWNSASLFKPGNRRKDDEKKIIQSEPREYISLPFKIRSFIKFVLTDFSLTINDLDTNGGDSLEAGVKDFNLRAFIITQKFRQIPLNIRIFNLLKSTVVHLDPQKKIDIYYKNKSSRLKSPMDFHWILTYDEKIKKEGFFSRLEIGHHDIPVEYKGTHLLPLNFGIDYDIKYEPSQDQMKFKFFRLSFAEDTWINLVGSIYSLSDNDQLNIDLKLNRSNINTEKIYPYFKALSGNDDISFRGDISFAPMEIKGPLNKLVLDGKINLYKFKLNFKDRNFDFGYLDLFYKSEIDKNLGSGFIPFARNLDVKWNGSLNRATLGAEIKYSINEKINLYTYAHNLNVEPFSGDLVSGLFNIDMRIKGPDEKNLTSSIDIKSNRFTYYLDRGISGINKLALKVNSSILFPGEGFGKILADVNTIVFKLNNEKNQKGISLQAAMNVDRSSEDLKISLDIKNLAANLNNLKSMLPGSYREKIENFAEASEKDIRFTGKTSYYLNGENSVVENTTNMYIDDLGIDDVILNAKVSKNAGLINIPLMKLQGLNDSLSANLDGKFSNEYRKTEYKTDDQVKTRYEKSWVPDIHYKLKLGQKDKNRIFKSYSIAGILDLAGYAKDNIINGRLNIDKMYLDNGNFSRINNVNLDFPFEHDRRFKKTLNLTAANKERIIKNADEDFRFNFTIESIEIPNPTKLKEPLKIVYPDGNYSGLSSAMRYKDNVFEMPMTQIFLLNGLVTVQDTLFNVGTGNLTEMEYRTLMQIKEIDFKQLIPAEKAASIKNGKISADILLTGKNMSNMLPNTNGYVSIYKIGRQFAKQGVKIIMPESSPLVSFVVDEWTIIHKFDIELKEGLAYAKILYSKGTFGNVIGLEGNEIVQERRPIGEIWQKAGEEVKIYQADNLAVPTYNSQ